MIEAKSAAHSLNNISKILDRLNGPRRGAREPGFPVLGPWSVWIRPGNPLNKMNAVCFSHICRN